MTHELFLLRYGEIGTKSERVRKEFEGILKQTIERTFLNKGKEVILEKRDRGRIFAHIDPEDSHLLSNIFGLVSYSPVTEVSSKKEDIKERCRKFVPERGTFAVRARRTGEHDYDSMELAEEVGAIILEENPELEVDLDHPDHEIHIEVRDTRAYIFKDIYEGLGGLPLSSQGKVASYVGDENGFLATWMMMKRGCRAYVYHPSDTEWAGKLEPYDPNLNRFEVEDLKALEDEDFPHYIEALILGDTLNQINELDVDIPVFRPLIGLNDERRKRLMDRIKRLREREI